MKACSSNLMQQFSIRRKTYAAVIVRVFDFWLCFVYLYECFHVYVCVREWGTAKRTMGWQSHTGLWGAGTRKPHGCLFQSWPLWRIKKSIENEWLVSVLAFLYMLPKSNAKQGSVFSSERNRDKGLYTAIAWSFILLVYWDAIFQQLFE